MGPPPTPHQRGGGCPPGSGAAPHLGAKVEGQGKQEDAQEGDGWDAVPQVGPPPKRGPCDSDQEHCKQRWEAGIREVLCGTGRHAAALQ